MLVLKKVIDISAALNIIILMLYIGFTCGYVLLTFTIFQKPLLTAELVMTNRNQLYSGPLSVVQRSNGLQGYRLVMSTSKNTVFTSLKYVR